jgi:predicted metallopeptidase
MIQRDGLQSGHRKLTFYEIIMIRYERADDIEGEITDLIHKLQMTHIDGSRVACVRSRGSKSKRIIARCHGLSRVMQLVLNEKPQYVIEFISERFDTLNAEDRVKVLIHELMHIPRSFGGGFRAHRPHVTRRKVERMYRKFLEVKGRPSR